MKSKFIISGKHFAYIDNYLLNVFKTECKIINFTAWVRENIYNDFGLYLKNDEDWIELEDAIAEAFYADKTEWLREKMRNQIKFVRKQQEDIC